VAGIWCLSACTAFAQGQVSDYVPVTDAELMNPAPGDWINWRRTLDGQGYSPLDQINRDTVADLQLVWSWATPTGTDQVTPLVHDGVMYVPSRSGVQALWTPRPATSSGDTPARTRRAPTRPGR